MKIASIILCAGQGTRMKSDKSKMLQDLCGRPLCYWSIKSVIEVSETKPVVVIGHEAALVQETLEKFFPNKLEFVKQAKLDGTGGAVKIAIDRIASDCDSVLIAYGDTPLLTSESLLKLINIQKRSHVPISMFSATTNEPTGYGRIIRNNQEHICAIVEEKDASMLEKEIKEINPGIFVFDLEFLKENLAKLCNNNAQKEYYLTDIIKLYIKNGPHLGPVENLETSYEEIHGVNDHKQLAFAQKLINKRLLNKHMLEGVKIIDQDNTYVDDAVKISSEVVLYPGVHLRGQTSIASGVIIENGSIIEDCIIEKDVHIYAYSVCQSSHLGEKASVGPFARIRPKTYLEESAKIGNFVEVKESKIGKNSKVNHLSYIGDTSIGKDCNIGAGSITCNFDGQNKHRTIINDESFVGSNTTLVAPIVVGKKAYIAAGSTITQEVPSETLAFGRARQEIKKFKKNKSHLIEGKA